MMTVDSGAFRWAYSPTSHFSELMAEATANRMSKAWRRNGCDMCAVW